MAVTVTSEEVSFRDAVGSRMKKHPGYIFATISVTFLDMNMRLHLHAAEGCKTKTVAYAQMISDKPRMSCKVLFSSAMHTHNPTFTSAEDTMDVFSSARL